MDGRTFFRWPLRRAKGHVFKEAGAALFQGVRIRLTLWYCGVLGVALILFGVALYIGTQNALLNPVDANATMHAQEHVGQWLADSPDHACLSQGFPGFPGSPAPALGSPMSEMVACFDQNGALLYNYTGTALPTAFLSNSLAKTVLQTGQVTHDIVNGGSTFGQIYRYARVVPNPTGSGYIGVVVIGESVQVQETTLNSLSNLMLIIGGLSLLGAGLGGLFLANRALVPVRLAWTHQQRFIADASHELRTPLTLLRADAEVLLRGRARMDVEDAMLLEDIVAEANHMSTLATNMLTLARLDNSATHREYEVVNLAELANAGVRRVQALADQKEISIHMEQENTPSVIGDPTLLEQAILALLDNALKYNRRGGQITVRTAVQHDHALLEVCDTGIGIAAEHLPHLGERFYRVDKARSREAGGTGLGLSIARGIAITHGGTLTLTSTLDQGTTVTLLLPLVRQLTGVGMK